MIVPRRVGEITFYEYLGVTPSASAEEIRDAFRAMVRLLHPDQQTDAQLKQIAETQMRKLNRVYSVLSDPARRRHYDELMEEDYGPAIIVNSAASIDVRRLVGRAAWIAAILLSGGLLIWFAAEDSPAFQAHLTEPNLTASYLPEPVSKPQYDGIDQMARISRLQSDLNSATVERDAAMGELRRLRDAWVTRSAGSLPAYAKTPFKSGSLADPIVRHSNRQLAGSWFYSKPPHGQINTNPALYPPEFIELTIADEDGLLRGRYRSRFQIGDRPISPDVNFTFQGTFNGSQISYPWTGPGGARGDLSLRLTSANLLHIDWSANELGTQQTLKSGTAVLTRRAD